MDRRRFLKTSAALTAGSVVAAHVSGCSEKAPTSLTDIDGYISEPARRIPVIASADVVVIGGGPAGVAAAISAAREGASVILLERYNHLGGLWTGGLVLATNCTHGTDRNGNRIYVLNGITKEILDELRKMGLLYGEVNAIVEPESCKYVLEKMTREAAVTVLYHTVAANVVMSGDRIDAVLAECKSGRVALKCKAVVDCSGDGDSMAWTGEDFRIQKYHAGLNFRLGNVDRVDEKAEGYLPTYTGIPTANPSVNWYNSTGYKDVDALNVFELSKLQSDLRMDAWKITEGIRAVPGYEKVFLLDTASQLGVRESRLLNGEYMLTLDDSMSFREFDDVVGVSGAFSSFNYKDKYVNSVERPAWQIPYRSLLPKTCQNLIIAGRCFSYDSGLIEDAREIGTCLVTGQAAGTAAALAARTRTRMSEMDVRTIQASLKKQNVYLG